MSKAKKNARNENRTMWTGAQRPRCTKNMVEKRLHDDKKHKKNYAYDVD